jgi:Flp pilus assembly protein TadG
MAHKTSMHPHLARKGHGRPRNRAGIVSVEFALVAPVFFALLFGALEFSRACNVIHTADNAAYEAARRGIVPGATTAQVQDIANSVLRTAGVRSSVITVNPPTITPSTSSVQVDVEVPMNANGFLNPVFFRNRVIRASMTMRREEFSQSSTP